MFNITPSTKLDKYIIQLRKAISDPLDIRQLLLYLITNISKELHLENISFLLHNKDAEEYELKESIKLNKSYLTIKENSALVQYFHNKRDLIFLSRIKNYIFKLEKKSQIKKANLDLLKELAKDMDGLQAELAVPFFRDNYLLGILCIGQKKFNKKITRGDLSFVLTISNEFANMIHSAVMYEELKNKEKEITSLYEVGKVISSLFDFKKTFDVIVRNTSILLKAPKILILLYDDFEAKFVIKKSFGFTDFQLSKIEETVRFKECTQTLSGSSDGILMKNKEENIHYEQSILLDLGINSIISIPLFDEDLKIIGELRIMRPVNQKPFNERDKEISTNLSNNIMVALSNSKRYQKSEENLIELSTVYNITKSLTSEFELDKIQKKVCSIFTDVLNFQRAILYLYAKGNLLVPQSASGWDEELYKNLNLDISKTWEGKALIEGRIFQVTPTSSDGYDRTSISALGLVNFVVIPLLIQNKKPIGVMVIDTGKETQGKSKINLRLLTAIANQSAIIIENARLYKESEELNEQLKKEQARTAKELQIARYIQQALLSSKFPENKALAIFGTNIPCRAVGGDFYHFIAHDEKNLGIVIGDVSGKGIPAALLMTMTNSLFSEFGKRFDSPEVIMQNTNTSLQSYLSKSPIFYVTAFYGLINMDSNLLKYCKAGHNPPILYRAGTEEIIYLDSEGTYLGTFDDGGFIEKNILVSNGDKLILYTDGITEVKNTKKQLFSKERLAHLIKTNSTLPAEKLTKLLISEAERYGDYREFADDITLVIVDFKELNPFKETTLYKLNYKIKNKLPNIKKTIKELLTKLEALEINKKVYNYIRLCISESLLNAYEHGNKQDPKKNIEIKGIITNRKVEVKITDEGKGFESGKLNYCDNQIDTTNRGRGILIIKTFMDEVRFNETGNEITLIKYI
ncbi:MAG: SpoIIE family protein phosphatase [Candidatus Margulisbacteria bacterium]|nr:SpoIIE family protein phosphatase [Candidatus Margulisiibacteriota bacterium]